MYLAKILITLLIFFSFGGDQINELVMTEKIRNNFPPFTFCFPIKQSTLSFQRGAPNKKAKTFYVLSYTKPNDNLTLEKQATVKKCSPILRLARKVPGLGDSP